jgi:hypothetical protein
MILLVLLVFLGLLHWTYGIRIERLEDTDRWLHTKPWEREEE